MSYSYDPEHDERYYQVAGLESIVHFGSIFGQLENNSVKELKFMGSNIQSLLELRLRQASGNEFQKFFAAYMRALFPNDFIPIRSLGSHGDGGMDGYLDSRGRVYQCYGAINGGVGDLSKLKKKIRDDFQTALRDQFHMKEWCFTHNLVEGLPSGVLSVLKEIEEEATRNQVKISRFGPERFEELVAALPESARRVLLGDSTVAGPILDAHILNDHAHPRFKWTDTNILREALKIAMWDVGGDQVVFPDDLKAWSRAAREMSKGVFQVPSISNADLDRYAQDWGNYMQFFDRLSPYKMENHLRSLMDNYIAVLTIRNTSDVADGGIEIKVSVEGGSRLVDLQDLRSTNDWGLSYPRPKHININEKRLGDDPLLEGTNAVRLQAKADTHAEYLIAELPGFSDVRIPICVSVRGDASDITVVIRSRKTGQQLNLETHSAHSFSVLDADQLLSILERSTGMMPQEQSHIMSMLIGSARYALEVSASDTKGNDFHIGEDVEDVVTPTP